MFRKIGNLITGLAAIYSILALAMLIGEWLRQIPLFPKQNHHLY